MKFRAFRDFNLIPIGKVSFTFKGKTKAYQSITGKFTISVNDVHILQDTDVDIDEETYKTLMAEMKKAKSDLLTDGHDFYTTRGMKITQIKHHIFNHIIDEEENKEAIYQLRFGR